MLTIWTKEDVKAIIGQLNEQNLPFKKYAFSQTDSGFDLIGKGASAYVYRAETRDQHKKGYAIKVIGFGDKHVESESFRTEVDIQKHLALFQNNIVKIYDSAEYIVWIEGNHNIAKVEKVKPDSEKEILEGNFLHLQFIVMEEITPVLTSNRFGKPSLEVHKLVVFDEKEIIKFAYDIGTALQQAHEEKLIHRDVKLENIFYSVKGGHYKLGDFGIARTTDDGLASTVAFTKGYGAPEVVGTLEDKYDYTADIYSFGMMLYVLLNELRFPASKSYHPNIMQYTRGFAADYPVNGSDELCNIVLKMISYDPDDRYQTMDEVLNEIEKLKYGRQRLKYQREHKAASLVIGASTALLGAMAFELSWMPELINGLSLFTAIFWGLCVFKGIVALRNKDVTWVHFFILGLGMYLSVSTGFTWWKLIGVIVLSFFLDESTGILGGSILIMYITHWIMKNSSINVLPEYRWISLLLISLSIFLLAYHYLLGERDELMVRLYLSKNLYWFVVAAFYGCVAISNFTEQSSYNIAVNLCRYMLGDQASEFLSNHNLLYIGAAGTVFCVLWIGRDISLRFIEKQIEKRKMYS